MADRWLYAWGLGSVSFGGASLLVPLYVVQLGARPVDLGILAATAAVIGAPGAVVFGRLANQVGHRRGLVLGTLGTVALALAAVPLLGSVLAVIVANAALWLVVAAVAPVLTMLVVADAPESAWNERIGRLNSVQGYGWAGGLVLGTVWPLLGTRLGGALASTRALFWLLAAAAAAATVVSARALPRPDPDAAAPSERQVRRIARLLSGSRAGVRGATFAFSPNRLYWSTRSIHLGRLRERLTPALATYLVAAALFFTGSAAFWAPLPLFLTDLGLTSGGIFGLYLVSSLASAVLYGPAGAMASRYDLRLLQSGAVAARGVVFPLVALVAALGSLALTFGAAAVALAAVGATWGFIAVLGSAIVVRLAPPSIRGEVLGVHTALAAVAGGVGGILGGWAAGFDYLLGFGVAGGLALVGAAVVFSLGAVSEGATSPTAAAGDRPAAAEADPRQEAPAGSDTDDSRAE